MYPIGQVSANSYFFNAEEIEEIYFEGYIDEQEQSYRQEYDKEIWEIKYPKFKVEDNKLLIAKRQITFEDKEAKGQ